MISEFSIFHQSVIQFRCGKHFSDFWILPIAFKRSQIVCCTIYFYHLFFHSQRVISIKYCLQFISINFPYQNLYLWTIATCMLFYKKLVLSTNDNFLINKFTICNMMMILFVHWYDVCWICLTDAIVITKNKAHSHQIFFTETFVSWRSFYISTSGTRVAFYISGLEK